MRCRRIAAALWAASFVAGMFASPAAAQEITGTITGTVLDSTGASLPGATVSVKSLDTGVTRDFQTTETGRYTAPFLHGRRLRADRHPHGLPAVHGQGHRRARERPPARSTRRSRSAQLTDVVEVTAGAQMVQPLPAVQTLMGPTQVEELPLNNRNFVQLATLVPGVNSSLPDEVGIGLTSTVSISIAGARRNGVNWLVDGASNVDVGSNITLLSTPSLESIEEFKIITSSYAAEWPRSGGGIVNVVTKSGTNQCRGSAYEFFRNDALEREQLLPQAGGLHGRLGRLLADAERRGHPREPGAPPLQQLRLHDRRAHQEGHAVLLLLAGVPPHLARAGGRERGRRPAGLADRPDERRTTWRPRCATRTRCACSRSGRSRTWARTASSPRARTTRTRGRRSLRLDWHAEPEVALHGALHARPVGDDGGGRPLLQHARARRRDHADRRARPDLRRAGDHDALARAC